MDKIARQRLAPDRRILPRRLPLRSLPPRRAAALAALALLGGCGTLSHMEIDASDAGRLRYAGGGDLRVEADSLARPLIEQNKTQALVIGVLLPDGTRQSFGYGSTEPLGGHAPDGDTLFAIGSLSKGFLSATAAVLVQQGVLRWDDTLGQLLPPGTPLSAASRKITLLQLATHTSGLPRQPLTPRTLFYLIEYLFTGENFYRHFDRAYLLDYLADFDGAPATAAPLYSNIGYGLLGYALELRTGKTVEQLVRETILQPLRLSHTGYAPERLPGYAARAQGRAGDQPKFIRRGQPVPDWRFSDVMAGSAALYSSANDLLTLAAAHLRGSGDAVRDRALQDTLAVRVERAEEAPALAWFVDQAGGRKITYQVGLVAGYSSYVGMDVPSGTAVVVLQNSFNWSNSVGHALLLRLAARTEGGKGDAPAGAPMERSVVAGQAGAPGRSVR